MDGYARLGPPAAPAALGIPARQPHPTHPRGVSLQQFFWMLLFQIVLKGKVPLCYGAVGGNPGSILAPSISSGK